MQALLVREIHKVVLFLCSLEIRISVTKYDYIINEIEMYHSYCLFVVWYIII